MSTIEIGSAARHTQALNQPGAAHAEARPIANPSNARTRMLTAALATLWYTRFGTHDETSVRLLPLNRAIVQEVFVCVTITIFVPPSGGQFGPGFRLHVETDAPGPLPPGNAWVAYIHPVDNELDLRYVDGLATTNPQAIWDWGAQPDSPMLLQNISAPVLHGTTVRLLVLRNVGTTLVESLSMSVQWNMTDGIPLWSDRRADARGQEGAFTAADRVTLEETQAATVVKMGAPGAEIDIPIASMIVHPPLGMTTLDPVGIPASGDGGLQLGPGPSRNWFGLWWEFATVPPAMGRDEGVTPIYEQRMVQLAVIHTVLGVDVQSEYIDASFERVVYRWAEAFPTRVEFSITPGVEVIFHPLVLGVP